MSKKQENEVYEGKTQNKGGLFLIGFFLFILLLGSIFELTILGIAFFNADKVECNFLWCTFTTTNNFQNDSIIIKTNKVCYYNGEEIDCDNNSLNLPIIPTNGNW